MNLGVADRNAPAGDAPVGASRLRRVPSRLTRYQLTQPIPTHKVQTVGPNHTNPKILNPNQPDFSANPIQTKPLAVSNHFHPSKANPN